MGGVMWDLSLRAGQLKKNTIYATTKVTMSLNWKGHHVIYRQHLEIRMYYALVIRVRNP